MTHTHHSVIRRRPGDAVRQIAAFVEGHALLWPHAIEPAPTDPIPRVRIREAFNGGPAELLRWHDGMVRVHTITAAPAPSRLPRCWEITVVGRLKSKGASVAVRATVRQLDLPESLHPSGSDPARIDVDLLRSWGSGAAVTL